MNVQNAHFARLLKDAQPVCGGELILSRYHLQRIRAVDAMQRTTVRNFGDESQGMLHYLIRKSFLTTESQRHREGQKEILLCDSVSLW